MAGLNVEGLLTGDMDGFNDGDILVLGLVGSCVEGAVGLREGDSLGIAENLNSLVGTSVGSSVGFPVGDSVGDKVGLSLGEDSVGASVGLPVLIFLSEGSTKIRMPE